MDVNRTFALFYLLLFLQPPLLEAIVRNGNFQELLDGLPRYWQHGSHDGGAYAFSAPVEDGDRFFRITGQAPEGRAFINQSHQEFERSQLTHLRLSFRYRGNSSQLDGFIRIRYNGVEVGRLPWLAVPGADNVWERFDQVFRMPDQPDGTPVVIRLESVLYLRGVGWVDYNDYAISFVDQPVRNPGFEAITTNLPLAWTPIAHDGDYTFSLETDHDGNRFARITGLLDEGRALWQQNSNAFYFPGIKQLRVHFRYKGTASKSDGFIRVHYNEDEVIQLPWSLSMNSDTWQYFERTYDLPPLFPVESGIRLQSILYLRGAGYLDIDDYYIELLGVNDLGNATFWDGDPRGMPFRPTHKAQLRQSPPDFSWPAIRGARYHLQITGDVEFSSIWGEWSSLEKNYFNPGISIPPGLYYWRVRAIGPAGEKSDWSESRRFRILPTAVSLIIPDAVALRNQVDMTRPRLYVSPGDLPLLRWQSRRQSWYGQDRARADAIIAEGLPEEPVFPYSMDATRDAEWIAAYNQLRNEGEKAANDVERLAYFYLISGEDYYGEQALLWLLNLVEWDPDGPTGYRIHDQVHRQITLQVAKAYDWLYVLMTPEEKVRITQLVHVRTMSMINELLASSHSLPIRPYNSHGWTTLGYLGIISLAMLGDIPDAEIWFDEVIPLYSSLYPLWGGEDGGWHQGNGYWRVSQFFSRLFVDALAQITGVNLYGKVAALNSGFFPLYNLPHGSPRSHFGDENQVVPDFYHVNHTRRIAGHWNNPKIRWAGAANGIPYTPSIFEKIQLLDAPDPEVPAGLPPSRWYRDTGWVAMHSDLLDPERISLYFKSSPIGSFNHSHADQNHFVINAFGEALAIDSGYFDWYHSPHDLGFAKQTLAHNAITYDGGKGQPVNDITAKGQIISFVTHPYFDATTGDASAAYKGALSRAMRHIIYLRPDVFMIIDRLGSPGNPRAFEWRIHALNEMLLDPDGSGALIEEGNARLRLDVLHAPEFSIIQTDSFVGPVDHYPEGTPPYPLRPQGRGENWPDQWHLTYKTEKLDTAYFVNLLRPYREGEMLSAYEVQSYGSLIDLTLEDGSRVWANRSPANLVNPGPVSFRGVAVATVSDGWLLVEGDYFEIADSYRLQADKPVTVAYSPGRLSVSSQLDTHIQLKKAMVHGILVEDFEGDTFPGAWVYDEGQLQLWLEAGSYTLLLNETPAWPSNEIVPVQAKIHIDGKRVLVDGQSMQGADGIIRHWYPLDLPKGEYALDRWPENVLISGGTLSETLLKVTGPVSLFYTGESELDLPSLTSNAHGSDVPYRLHIHPEGDDRNDGRSVEFPLRTLQQANELLEVERPDSDVEVIIAGGLYRNQNVTWTYAPGGRHLTFKTCLSSYYPAVFDGRPSNEAAPSGDIFFTLSPTSAPVGSLHIKGIRVQHYWAALHFLEIHQAGGTGHTVANNFFQGLTYGVICNASPYNDFHNNDFVDISTQGSAIYLVNHSHTQRIVRNRFTVEEESMLIGGEKAPFLEWEDNITGSQVNSYDNWVHRHFSPELRNDALSVSEGIDINMDGVTNRDAWVWGISPHQYGKPVLQIDMESTQRIFLLFPSWPDRHYKVWHSKDLRSWSETGLQTEGDGGLQTLSLEIEDGVLFYQLEVILE